MPSERRVWEGRIINVRTDFVEARCVQCGMCAATCPERTITLEPRLDLSESARQARPLKQDATALCTACGFQVGSQRTIEGVVALPVGLGLD